MGPRHNISNACLKYSIFFFYTLLFFFSLTKCRSYGDDFSLGPRWKRGEGGRAGTAELGHVPAKLYIRDKMELKS